MGERSTARSWRKRLRPYLAIAATVALGAGAAVGATAANAATSSASGFAGYQTPALVSASLYHNETTTPIQHVVVIFGENISFDHYFGTYPYATNPPGEPQFTPLPARPTVNGLDDRRC